MSHALAFARATARDATRNPRRRLFTREHRAPSFPPPPSLLLVLSVSTPRPVRVSPFAYTILPVLNAKRHSKLGTLAVPSERASTPRAIAFTCLTLPSPILAVSAPRISTDRINVGLVGDKTPD